jgi:clan AA aspartic protease
MRRAKNGQEDEDVSETIVEVTIINPKNKKEMVVDMLVDSGSEVTTLSKDIAEGLGLNTKEKEKIELYANKTVSFPTANAEIKVQGRKVPIKAYVVDKPREMVLAINVIEALGFNINPVEGRLVKRSLRFPFRSSEPQSKPRRMRM